jgi:hypothetical protein
VLATRPLSDTHLVGVVVKMVDNDGRYLQPLWLLGVMGHSSGIQFLKYVRLLTLVGIFLSSWMFLKLLRSYLWEDPLESALMAALFAVNPAFLIVGGWTMTGSISYAVFLGLSAIYLLLRHDRKLPVETHAARSVPLFGFGVLEGIGAAVLLFVSMCIYQPGAMAYWTGAAVWILGRFAGRRQDWIKLAGIFGLFFVVSLIYFLIVSSQADAASRVHLSLNLIRRAAWFVVFPLRTALYFPFVTASFIWSILAFLLLSWGLVLYSRQTSRSFWVPLLIGIILPLTLLPSLMSYVHYDVLRIKASLFGVIILLWSIACKVLPGRLGLSFRPAHLLVVGLVIAGVAGEFCLQRYFVIPQIREESAVQMKLLDYVRENPKMDRPIALFPAVRDARFTGMKPTDELGLPSTSQFWSANNLVYQVLAGITNRNYEDVKDVKVIDLNNNDTAPAGAFVIDLRELRVPR